MSLKNLLSNNSKDRELFEQMCAAMREMQEERDRCQLLIIDLRTSNARLQDLDAPVTKAKTDVDAVAKRLAEVEQRFSAILQLSSTLPSLDLRAENLAENQRRAEAQLGNVLEDARKFRSMYEELSQRVDSALQLKERIGNFMDVERPFQQLRSDAETLRGQVDGTAENMTKLQDQNGRTMEAQKLAAAKLEAIERRCEELGRVLQDKEHRVSAVEEATQKIDGLQQTIDDLTREIGTLKALGNSVVEKSATLEVQRDTVERAIAQADLLDRAMRQIEVGLRQQQEHEKSLNVLQSQMNTLRSLHGSLQERSNEISQLQRDTDEQTRTTRQQLTSLSLEMKKVTERFEFESQGLESVSQRVSDLRVTLSDYENRFTGLGESSMAATEIRSQTVALGEQVRGLSAEVNQVDRDVAKFQSVRRELEETSQTARDISTRFSQIEAARVTVEGALRDFEQLNAVHAIVKDSLEQAQFAHGEIARFREGQSDARSWMAEVERSVKDLKDQVADVSRLAPTIEVAQKQAQRLSDSLSDIERRRGLVDTLQRRMDDLSDLGGKLDERGRQLQSQMEVTEERFTGLSRRAEEAERLGETVANMSGQVNEAERKADAIAKNIAGVAARCESVEALAEQTRALRPELEQRQRSLSEASKSLAQASEMRKEAASAAQQLEELSRRLTATLSAVEDRARHLDDLATKIDGRADGLKAIERRLGQFDERLSKWGPVEQEIGRTLEQIIARQGTVESLQLDLNRMIMMAEKTAKEVREITSAHGEIEQSRGLLTEVMNGLRDIKGTANSLDERKRQMGKAEERLTRAEALLMDVRSSLETLQAQKAVVDQAVEKAGSLKFLIKQAEAMIEGWRDEREMTVRVRSAVADARDNNGGTGGQEANAA